ncbi:hypothetical protein [Pseudomonas syringae]
MDKNKRNGIKGSNVESMAGDQDPVFGIDGQVLGRRARVFTELGAGTDQKFYLITNGEHRTPSPFPSSISRHLANGKPDPDFNNGETLILPGLTDQPGLVGGDIRIQGLIFDQRGAVMCVGDTKLEVRELNYHYPAAIRLTSSGALDVDFGDRGRVVYPTGQPSKNAPEVPPFPFTSIRRSQQQENKDILFVSQILDYDTQMRSCYLVKTKQNGLPDDQFGHDGLLLIGSDADGPIWNDYGVDGGGNLLLIGESAAGAQAYGVIAKYTTEGVLDSNYGSGGIQKIQGGEEPPYLVRVHVMADGSVTMLVAVSRQNITALALMKRLENGAPDTSFNNGEPRILDTVFATSGRWPEMHIDDKGRYLLAYYSQENGCELKRFTPDGIPDISFGSNGTAGYPDLLALNNTAIHRGADLLAKIYRKQGDGNFYVVRYLGESVPGH